MEKHTPGPWRYEEGTKTIRAVSSNRWIATVDSWDAGVNNQVNAQLIAAAPDLLEACEFALLKLSLQEGDKVLGGSQWDEFKSKAKAAIAKTQGK